MSKMYSTNNDLEKKYELYNKKAKYAFIGLIASFILFLPTLGIAAVPFILFAISYGQNKQKADTYKRGLEGEQQTCSVLALLPDSYIILYNLNIQVNGRHSQIDHVVIGDNGIFVVETKNVNGRISGTAEDHEVIQYKTGQQGGQYSKRLYNPIRQVSTHVFNISALLKSNNINTWIQGIVYFSNPQAQVNLVSNKIPVFSEYINGSSDMNTYITNYQCRGYKLSSEQKQKLVNILQCNLINTTINNATGIDNMKCIVNK